MEIIDLLRDGRGFVSAAAIRGAKIPRAEFESAVESQRLIRLRRGLYASPDVPEADREAVGLGGVLTCVSLLKALNLWVTERDRLHVAVPGHAGGGRVHGRARFHWRSWPGFERGSFSRDSIESALLHMITCVDEADAVVMMDSAMNTGAITPSALEGLRASAPAGKRHLFDRVDPAAMSGLESRVRLAFAARGHRVRTQVPISGVGIVDILIGDRLVIETDGDRWHSEKEQRMTDYRRTLTLQEIEYLPVRLDYEQVMDEWATTEAKIGACIRRREHLWTPAQRRRRTNGG